MPNNPTFRDRQDLPGKGDELVDRVSQLTEKVERLAVSQWQSTDDLEDVRREREEAESVSLQISIFWYVLISSS